MKINRLRSIIRESISNNLKEIEDVAENAAMEAKLNAYTEAIDKVNKKIEMAESLEEMQELVDPTKLNELKKHLKTLEKSKEKLEKVKAKKNKKKVVTDEPVEDTEVEEGAGPGSTNYNMGDDIANINGEEGDVDFSTDEENAAINESFLKMQKLAGVITEAQYNQKKSLIKENKALSSEEQETLDFILGGENLEEGVSQILDKIKSVARKGALTLGIAASLLNAVPASAKADVLTTIEMAAPELDLSTIKTADYSKASSEMSKEDPILVTLTTSLKSTNPYIIKSKTYGDNIPFSSFNWGANAGKQNATVGLSVSKDSNKDEIVISISKVPGKSTKGYEAMVAAAKSLGGKIDSGSSSTTIKIPGSNSNDVANFIKANISNINL